MIIIQKVGTTSWETPLVLYNKLNKEFNFTLDPCATEDTAKTEKYYTKKDSGLKHSWTGERVFMNPPYGNEINKWLRKACLEHIKGVLVVCLISVRTDTKWWHNYVMRATEIRFIEGRLTFGDAENVAPFSSAIVVYDKKVNTPKISSYQI